MTDLVTRGQLDLLAQTMAAPVAELESLARLGADDIRALRERISALLYDAHADTFARVSKLAPLIPNALAAKVALKAVPPEVAGRAGGAIGIDHPDRAAGLLGALTTTYMADAAPFLDPRAIAVLAPRIPAAVLIPAANELLARRDYVTAASFLDHAPDELIADFERGIGDDAGLLHTAALSSSAERLAHVIRLLPPGRRERILRTATSGAPATALAGLSVLARLDSDIGRELCDTLFGGPDVETGILFTAAHTAGAHKEILTCVAALDDSILTKLARHPALADRETVVALAAAADTDEHRTALLAIASYGGEELRGWIAAALPEPADQLTEAAR
ncbi:hypothetical protein ACWDOP_05265 [Nocardia sp. NPDC003693]